MKIGFDNEKYLTMQSEHICIWNSAENYLMIITPPESFRDSHLTAS